MRLGHEKQMHAIKRDETLRDEGVPATAVRIYHVSMYIPYVDSRVQHGDGAETTVSPPTPERKVFSSCESVRYYDPAQANPNVPVRLLIAKLGIARTCRHARVTATTSPQPRPRPEMQQPET